MKAQRGRPDPEPPPSAGTRRWFVVGPFALPAQAQGSSRTWMTWGPVHAKEMGTRFTACGADAGSWFKLWDVDFEPARHDACQLCVAAVAQHRH